VGKFCPVISHARSVQGEAEADFRRPVEKGWSRLGVDILLTLGFETFSLHCPNTIKQLDVRSATACK